MRVSGRVLLVFMFLSLTVLLSAYSFTLFCDDECDPVSLGMGKSSFISNTGAGTLFRNPARLASLNSWEFSTAMSVRKEKYDRFINSDSDNSIDAQKIQMEPEVPSSFSYAAFAMPIALKGNSNLAFAFGYRKQIDVTEKSDLTIINIQNEQFEEYYDQKGGLNHLSFGLGYQANKRFSIGTSYHIGLNSKYDIQQKEYDADEVEESNTDYKFHYMTFSMLGQLGNHIELGMAYRSEYILRSESKSVSGSDSNEYSGHLLMPEEWTAGISLYNDYFKLNAEYVLPYYLRYNHYSWIPLADKNGNKFRIGAEGKAKKFTFRAGTYHEDVIIPFVSVKRQIGYTFGMGVNFVKNTHLDFAADFCTLDFKLGANDYEYNTQKYLLGLSLSY